MNALTELPGFVTFKDAHLVRGKPSTKIIRACQRSQWNPDSQSSQFPDPREFDANALFLAIELEDAGTVLDEVPLTEIKEVWDVFIGTVVALATAEHVFQFEVRISAPLHRLPLIRSQHRDLHENNICITVGQPSVLAPSIDHQRYGLSGLKVTLLDYGLSRAKLENGDDVYCDLEEDLEVFRGSPGYSQFDTYRR